MVVFVVDDVVVGALQLRAGELIGLVDAELVGESPVSLLLLLSVVPATRSVEKQQKKY